MSARIKPWLVLAVIFVAGILTGWALTIALQSHFDHPMGGAQMSKRIMVKLTERLKLTDQQQAQITPLIEEQTAKIQAIHREEIGRVSAIIRDSDDKIAVLLTPDQQAAFKDLIAEREKMFASHSHSWDHFGDGDHAGPDKNGAPPAPPGPPPH
jgi:Spy/CpxP family protein refolding chaperone